MTKQWVSAACVIAMIAALIISMAEGVNREGKRMEYQKFMGDLEDGRVQSVVMENQDDLSVMLKDGGDYITDNPQSESFKESLLMGGVDVRSAAGAGGIEWTSLLCIGALGFALYRLRGNERGMTDMQGASDAAKNPPSTTFSDFAGNPEALAGMRTLVDFLKDPERYRRLGVRLPRGVLLYGPPGTGKTLLARALAGEAGVPILAVSGSDFVQMYVGVGAARVRDLFKKAREHKRCVIFIDELDALGRRRSGAENGNDERDQTLNALLTEMQGFHPHEGVLVVAATNRRDTLDEALLRPGRFDRHIEVGLPDREARRAILTVCARSVVVDEGVDIDGLAERTVGFSGAMLESMFNEAGIMAARRDASFVDAQDIERAYYEVLAGSERQTALDEGDRRIIAAHEAGHAVASRLFAPEDAVHRVTIVPSTKGAGGYVLRVPPERMRSRASMEAAVRIALAGRAAEELVFGQKLISTGAVADLSEATKLLYTMAGRMGFIEEAGLISYDALPMTHEHLLPVLKAAMGVLYRQTLDALCDNEAALRRVMERLLEAESIDGAELEGLVGG